MPKRLDKPRDPSEIARYVLDTVVPDTEPPKAEKEKNPAAVVLGRLGGLKGGLSLIPLAVLNHVGDVSVSCLHLSKRSAKTLRPHYEFIRRRKPACIAHIFTPNQPSALDR